MSTTDIPKTTGDQRQQLLKNLDGDIGTMRKKYQPLLDKDPILKVPFDALDKAVDDRMREKR